MSADTKPADEFGNDSTLESLWAMKTAEYMEIYFNILCSVDPKHLRICPQDDVIYACFRQEFPDMDVKVLNEDEIKSPSGKTRWRQFCERFKDVVEDYSFGTMIRVDCTADYSPENSILVPRVQFYAIESARNHEGHNDNIRKKFKNINVTPEAIASN